jgi:hypothetical protein
MSGAVPGASDILRIVMASLVLAASGSPRDALAQTITVTTVDKQRQYLQTSPTEVALFGATNCSQGGCAYRFNARVDGQNLGSIAAPVLSGPIDTVGLGPSWNGGRLVFNAPGVWQLPERQFATSADLDAKFANGVYTMTANGTASTMNLQGSYPEIPVLTLSGGQWDSGGRYVIDPRQPLTITTSDYAGWGSHQDDGLFLVVGTNGTNILSVGRHRSGGGGPNSISLTVPANTFVAGQQYYAVGTFQAFSDQHNGPPERSVSAVFSTLTSVFIKADLPPPVFPMTVTANITPTTVTASAAIQYRPQDVGTLGSIFVFALAPANRVLSADTTGVLKVGLAKDERKADTPIACVLAQMNAAGQLVAVTSANLAAYLTAVLTAQGASISILNGVPTSNVSGATFFVGYGPSATAMLNTGVNRAAFTVPGSLTCIPSAPQTGWWWNPLEDGRGFSIEKRGNNLFFAAFLYDISGRSTWYVSSGPVSLEGSLYNGELLSASGGQTLGGPYVRFPTLANAGPMTMTFNNESTGTIVWPGGTVPIQRFNIVPNGLTALPVEGTPESGWWWNEQEAGRGFFMEWQNGTLDIAGYMYDDQGNPVWYLTVGEIGGTPAARSFSGTWWSYTGGQTLTGAWRQNARTNSNVAPMAITFSGPDTALMTLPNGRTTNLKRHRF